MRKYIINLKVDNQLLYKLIYSFGLIELETFKTYIKIYLVNDFTRLFNLLLILLSYC